MNQSPPVTLQDKEKPLSEHNEYAKSDTAPANEHDVVLPESLIGLSDEETSTMDKRITRRIDLIIMPVSEERQSCCTQCMADDQMTVRSSFCFVSHGVSNR